jgi:hypothetical protein
MVDFFRLKIYKFKIDESTIVFDFKLRKILAGLHEKCLAFLEKHQIIFPLTIRTLPKINPNYLENIKN